MKKCNQIIDMKRVLITIDDGDMIEGKPINIDYADDTGRSEDAICIETDSGIIVAIDENAIKSYQEIK